MLRLLGRFAVCVALLSCGNRSNVQPDVAPDTGPPDTGDPLAWNACVVGQTRCLMNEYQVCQANGEFTQVMTTNCNPAGQACVLALGGCVACTPGSVNCTPDYTAVETCRMDGSGYDVTTTCDMVNGFVCRSAACVALCAASTIVGTNIGCEYYAADLDQAQLGPGSNAASQPYAIVVSNPDPQFTARVHIEWNTAPQGMPPVTATVASAIIPPMDLEVFPLPERQVNCPQMMTDYDTGLHTCLSSQAYHIVSTAPVIAFQFNPLTNDVHVFSNDASMLIPTNSVGSDYQVMGWAETLASSPPDIVLNPSMPNDLRAFITVIGTAANTHVTVTPTADVLAGNVLPARGLAGAPFTVTLGAFDVLNLETDAFQADFTGSTVTTDNPVVVFSGSQCSDVPIWSNLNDRKCCCDHLESQSFARNNNGSHYFAVHTPNRTPVVQAAGAAIALIANEPEFFRVLAVSPGTTTVTTTLPTDIDMPTSPPLTFTLTQGEYRTMPAYRHFQIDATAPISVANFMSSQQNTGIPLTYPGGDPSFIPIPPVEQWRASYVFLTPDSYAFDFVQIVAPATAQVQLDGTMLPTAECVSTRADGCVSTPTVTCAPAQTVVWNCQLSYPIISNDIPYPDNVMPGLQRDGVHTVTASAPVGVIVSGFDLRVSYGYPAGTQLRQLF